jgi:hypothetical protein
MSRIRPHLTYPNVMSTIAVFAVLAGGTAWAASKIGMPEFVVGDRGGRCEPTPREMLVNK